MSQKLSVVVQLDPENNRCHLRVSGFLTERNQRGLHGLIRRARALPTGGQVVVDLSAAPSATARAVGLLHRAVDEDGLLHGGSAVQFVVPEPTHPAPPAAGGPHSAGTRHHPTRGSRDRIPALSGPRSAG